MFAKLNCLTIELAYFIEIDGISPESLILKEKCEFFCARGSISLCFDDYG
jgi:hypothetical protein